MRNRDYTRELSLASSQSRLPWPVTVVVIGAVLAVGVWFAREVNAQPTPHESAKPVVASAH